MTYTVAMLNNGSVLLGSNDFEFIKMWMMAEGDNRDSARDGYQRRITEIREYNSYDEFAAGVEPLRIKETTWKRTQCPMVRESLRMIDREKMEKRIEASRANKARKARNKIAAKKARERMIAS